MSDEPKTDAARQEMENREHEKEARERSEVERDDPVGTPDGDAIPAPPGPAQGGNLGGAS